MWSGIDKRKFPRASYPCKVKVTSRIFSHVFETRTENIGEGGICVILEKQLKQFAEVDIELYLDDGQPMIKCMARIVWVVKRAQYIKHMPNHFDTGIEFVDIDDKDRSRIAALVDRLSQLEESSGQE